MVKSFVYTSSSTASFSPVADKKMKITKDMFNEAAMEAAYKPTASSFEVYAASKTAAEKALWEAVKASPPSFQVATVLPDVNFGRILKPNDNSTGNWIPDLYAGNEFPMGDLAQWFVDVEDDAKLHVAALIDPECDGQRIFAFAEPYTRNDMLAISSGS
ncbi:uncharacterized protein RCC_11247 [Ramularia collo-cygni]|uniref:Uncharacterized protein n=1 Tax=Ramularia collo-cygni TaxID=112498 RepID=A0A2D3VQF9_9PEZI|nr:uncharacterized protein RCC_11247 [Ramularia collo-cygni]CZT25514.1 uncharacterized protein RCC_11247 [Ramularia collo-cygni]